MTPDSAVTRGYATALGEETPVLPNDN